MLLTLTTTDNPATDLGHLLHKKPAKLHSFELSFGKAHVFYPEATARKGGSSFPRGSILTHSIDLDQYMSFNA
jgi:RNA repair, ligase-Pnkp-associating, region of Hen1